MARPFAIDRAFLLDTAVSLVNIESVAPGEHAVIDALESLAVNLGMKTRRIPLEPGRDNLLASVGEGYPVVCLDAHVDTVPPSGRSVPKATIEGGRLLGLGACDDKGPLAAMLAAVKALIESGWNGPGRIDLLMTLEEETVGRGIRAVADSGYQCDYAICAEPTNLRIAVAHPGLVFLEVRAEGRAAHGSLPEKGVNAVELAHGFVEDMRRTIASWPKHPLAGYSSVNLGALHGGDRPNRVPDHATALIDVRVAPPKTVQDAARLTANLAQKRSGIKTNVVMMGEALDTDPKGVLVGALRKAALAVTGKRARTVGWRAWSEAGVLQGAARSQVAVFGPGQLEQAHSSDEFIDVEQLRASAEIYARAVSLLLESKK